MAEPASITSLPPADAHHGLGEGPPPREPPADIEVEMALLGALLVNNGAFDRVADVIDSDAFADAAHQKIFTAIQKLIESGRQATATTLRRQFEQEETLKDLGGARYLAELAAGAANIIDAADYARLVHDLHLRRSLIDIGTDTVNGAYIADADIDAEDLIEETEQKLFDLAETGNVDSGFQAFGDTLAKAIEMAETAFNREGQLTGTPTGFKELDKKLGGLQKSDLLILAGRPGMGKTALATNIAFNAAKALTHDDNEERGHSIAFFSLEMSSEQLALRILAEASEVQSDHIRRGQIEQHDFDKVFEASEKLSRLKLFIDDTPAISVTALRTRARRLLRTEKRLDLIVVDYLQLMQPPRTARTDNRVQEISEITRGLKTIAKELNVPVLALSQLSRAVEQRDDKRPQLADLRESGSIEQDADVVMFVYREEYYLDRKEPSPDKAEEYAQWQAEMENVHGTAEVLIAKQRHGPTGTAKLAFEGKYTRFSDLEDHAADYPDYG
jgi:replicative DNA helicase